MKHYNKDSVVNEFTKAQKAEFEGYYTPFAKELRKLAKLKGERIPAAYINSAAHNLACIAVWRNEDA